MTMLKDDVFTVDTELSSNRHAITIQEETERNSPGTKSPERLKSLEPSNSSEDSNSNNPTRDTDGRDHEEPLPITPTKEEKTQKYSSMSAEVCFPKSRPVVQRKLSRKVDVRYVNIKQKIKSSCMVACDQQQCPVIQERLNHHKRMHHSKYKKIDNACSTRMKMADQAVNVSPTLSRSRLPKCTLPHLDEGRCVQTDITMTDFSPNRFYIKKPTNEPTSDDKTDIFDVGSRRNIYKDHLRNEILDWLRNVPMFFSLNLTTKDIKDNVVYNLVENINALTLEANEETYESKTKMRIDECLNRLPMWLHGTKKEQILFKDSLKEKLWNKIIGLNKIFLGINYERDVDIKLKSNRSYEREIIDWSLQLLLDPAGSVTRRQIVDLLKKRLYPLLKIPLHTTSYKLILKGEIIDILDDMPLMFTSPRYRTVQLNKLAEELANRLLSIQIKQELSSPKNARMSASVFRQIAGQVTGLPVPKPVYNHKDLVWQKVGECLDKFPVCNRFDLQTEICSSFIDSKCCLYSGINGITIKDEISQFLRDTGKVSVDKSQIIANMIVKHVICGLKDARKTATTSFDSVIPELTGAISVYTLGSNNFQLLPVTSTPKKAQKKDVPKLNPNETNYIEQVAALVTVWMNSLPKQYNDEPGFKKTIIYDLAGDIMDHQKLHQLAPESVSDNEKYQKYLIYKWLCKFSFFEDSKLRTDAVPLVTEFQRKLRNIPVPNLTASQHGTRQEMEHIKHMEGGRGWKEDYVPKGIDVLEDQISVWMNEQPSEIYNSKDKGKRNKMVHELALNLQDHLRNKDEESKIEADINQWLKKVVKPKEKEHINLLTQDLKAKIVELPQDQTLGVRHEERNREMLVKMAAKRQKAAGGPSTDYNEDVSNIGNIQGDPVRTIREFIGKYIEHYYDIDDPMAQGAFAHLLKTELRKLAPPTRKDVYKHFEQSKTHQRFRPESLYNELEYIKIISDWLNNIPIDPSYNTVGNKDRIHFINDLARNIQEIEEERNENPNVMNYNYLIASTILTSMNTYDLPIPREHMNNTHLMANQLLEKVAELRPSESHITQASAANDSLSSSIMMSDIKEQNLSDFINDYIRINGREIADDELKLEAWTARLLKEIKKMANEGIDPTKLTKAQVYEKFASVPIPTEESVEAFGLKIHYVKEISDWMKNLPLLPIHKNDIESAEERIEMISELSEKMCDTEAIRRANPNDNSADKQLEEYIANWISSLPLDKSKDINIPILVQQLMIRMNKGSRHGSKASLEKQPTSPGKSINKILSSSKKGKEDQKSSSKHLPRNVSKECCKGKTPAEVIVEAIETWSNKLPIKMQDKDTVKAMKEDIARQLYQKIGELNVDPRVFNDELLYRELLDDEIETQLENVPQNSELQTKREQLKEGLINQIVGTNQIIKENSAGDNYRHKLETTIDASIPNPVKSEQVFDPGFEIYKNHLADMFILENFDHANDDVKATHEKRIRRAIDKYFASAQNKNALPLDKNQIYNELYSALFKVPMPNENSVIDEVEQVKTRCEIDAWYEKLPIQETDNINELLERDQILSTLAKKIHEYEKTGCKADENINKETRKWLEKLPLQSGQQGIDEHVKQLQNILKSTAAARKYVPPEPETKGKSKKVVHKAKKGAKDPNTSQVPGPSLYVPPKSSALQSKSTNVKPCCQSISPMSDKKPGDMIAEIVEEWCKQLPLISTEENNKAIMDNVATRIIILISELNMDSEIFNDDFVYDELLDVELDKVMAGLPVCCDFDKSINARKYQLKQQIKSIKPLIKEEKARYSYKQELNSTVASILKEPHDTSADKLAEFNKLKEEIVENFVLYYYHLNDEDARQFYKNQIHDAVVKFCIEIEDNAGTGEKVDPLIKRNQLLCELQKIPVPETALKEEVAEIKMKKEVIQFLHEQSIPDGDTKETVIKHLAKKLSNIEKSGYSPTNEKKMKLDISRCITKLKKEVSPQAVQSFVTKLKYNEAERNAPPMTSSQASNLNQDEIVQDCRSTSLKQYGTYQPGMPIQTTDTDANYYTPISIHPYGSQARALSPNERRPEQPLSESPMRTGDFRSRSFLRSSANPQVVTPHSMIPQSHLSRPPMNLNVSLGSAMPSLEREPLSKSFPQYRPTHRMREATSGPMLSTPRQVKQSPYSPQQQQGLVPAKDTTSDSIFEAPIFEPVPFPYSDPFQLASSGRHTLPRRPFGGPDYARGFRMQAGPIVDDRGPPAIGGSDDDETCICERCSPKNRRGIPVCLMPMDHSFEDCLGVPLWYGMHFPDCIFY
ncbi:hypothetical protein PYW08_011103 [Mythimna loreyi]|uniref:Uncharacterized protein n=1 Tax=Mythimna loreyi TaxID=667449 RepID=A0ACC2Q2G9_9NEOP|nr:hypothetical protein PYW08_011103 [Mythimna loreyi]